MFGFLKNKLKEAINKISEKFEKETKVEESIETLEETKIQDKEKAVEPKKEIKEQDLEIKQEIIEEKIKPEIKIQKQEIIKEEPKIEIKEKNNFFDIFKKKKTEENIEKVEKEEIKDDKEEKSFFKKLAEKITTKTIDEEKFEKLFSDLELVLLENNVALEVIDKIREDLKVDLVNVPIKGKINDLILKSLKESLEFVLKESSFDLINEIKNKQNKPYIIVFVGINGSGKTTTIAKLANLLIKNNLKCCLVAADTFRAASIQQLEEHANNLKVKLIKHDYNADPSAVGFDGVKYAKAHNLDAVLIDTAGRQHSNKNLMEEMKKIIKVVKPDLKVFIGESITGNDCIEQIKEFNNSITIDSIILSKLDVDEKGGTAISISYISGKPILYAGIGQKYDDLEKFDKNKILTSLGI
jgi:fused signal recognition particle receptor